MNEPNEDLKYEIVSVGLKRPTCISKSLIRSIGCERYFTEQALRPEFKKFGEEHYLARTGKEFHAWREQYVAHLVESNQWSDPGFVETYLAEHVVSRDAEKLIRRDAEKFRIDPESVLETEVFLSVDRHFKPLEYIRGREPGKLSTHPDALLSGQPDLVLLDGKVVTIVDPKSGFSTVGVTNHEPPFYAALIFAHFPAVEEVRWVWDFARVDAIRRSNYTRDDLPWIQKEILAFAAKVGDIVDRYNRGEEMGENPAAGLCPYCIVGHCSMRQKFRAGDLALGPIQSDEDAEEIALRKKAADTYSDLAGPLLKFWLDQKNEGRQAIAGGEWEAALKVSEWHKFPLVEALNLLGLDLVAIDGVHPIIQQKIQDERPDKSPRFGVPLNKLTVGGLMVYSKAKSRAGLEDELHAIAVRGAKTELVIRKSTEDPDLTDLLQQSIQQQISGGQ